MWKLLLFKWFLLNSILRAALYLYEIWECAFNYLLSVQRVKQYKSFCFCLQAVTLFANFGLNMVQIKPACGTFISLLCLTNSQMSHIVSGTRSRRLCHCWVSEPPRGHLYSKGGMMLVSCHTQGCFFFFFFFWVGSVGDVIAWGAKNSIKVPPTSFLLINRLG